MTTQTGTQLDVHDLDAIIGFFKSAYEPVRTDSKEQPLHDPFIARRDRINKNTKGLEKNVEEILGESKTASKANAELIIHKLAYAAAQADGYKGVENFKDEDLRKYLSQASAATGDPTIGNKVELKKSIMSMISARPGTTEYNADSPLGHLISYIAAQKDEESKKINHYRTVLSEHWTEPGTGLMLQKALGGSFNIPLHEIATASNFFTELEQRTAARSQLRTIETTPKPYLQGSASHTPSYSGVPAASDPLTKPA